jgi:two-component system, OmpR family, sensor histidine kinase ArlS
MKLFQLENVSLKWKLTFLSAIAIFITYFVFTFLQYHVVKQWLLNEEEKAMKKTVEEIETYYAEKRNLSWEDIRQSKQLLEKLNENYQLIRVLDRKGNVVVSVSNSASISLSPSGAPKELQMDYHFVNDERFIILREPLHTSTVNGTIEIARRLVKFRRMTNMLFFIMTVIGIAAMITSAFAGRLVAQNFVGRLKTLTKTMMDIKNKEMKKRIDVPASKDEMSELMAMFNKMMDEIERLFDQQKQFVEDASHELRTPIAILEGHLSLLQRWGKHNPDILEESLKAATQEVERLKKLALELLDLSRAETITVPDDIAPIDPKQTIEQVVKNFHVLYPNFQFIIDDLLSGTVRIRMTKYHFEQLLLILLDNAVKYTQQAKQVAISIKEEERFVTVAVKDYGIGIPRDQLEKVFLRFYRVDKARSREKGGVGLGLAIAKEIIDKYNGQITIDSEVGKGTTVALSIPREK